MTQSIITKYHGPTNNKPSRMSATTSSGQRKMRAADYHLTADGNHADAAQAYARHLKWPGQWQGAALNDKGDMVWVNTSDAFAKNYRFET